MLVPDVSLLALPACSAPFDNTVPSVPTTRYFYALTHSDSPFAGAVGLNARSFAWRYFAGLSKFAGTTSLCGRSS